MLRVWNLDSSGIIKIIVQSKHNKHWLNVLENIVRTCNIQEVMIILVIPYGKINSNILREPLSISGLNIYHLDLSMPVPVYIFREKRKFHNLSFQENN